MAAGLTLKSVTDRHFETLANWPELLTLRIDEGIVETSGLSHVRKQSSLRELWLENVTVRDNQWTHLQHPTLRLLSLRGSTIDDAGVETLTELPELKEVHLERTDVTSKAMKHLVRMPSLTHLWFDPRLDDEALHWLATTPRLQIVTAQTLALDVSDAGLADLGKLTWLKKRKLRIFDAGGENQPAISDDGLTRLWERLQVSASITARDVSVKGLALEVDGLSLDQSLATSVPLDKLITEPVGRASKLDLGSPPIIRFEIWNRAQQKHYFRIQRPHAVAKNECPAEILRFFPNITELSLGGCTQRTVTDWSNLRFVKRLQVLELDHTCKLDEAAVRFIGQMSELRELSADMTHLSAESFAPLGQLSSLKKLHIRLAVAEPSHVKTISRLTKLSDLFLSVPITDADIPYLSELLDLKRISISGKGVTIDGLRLLVSSLKNIESLDARPTSVTDEELRRLSAELWKRRINVRSDR